MNRNATLAVIAGCVLLVFGLTAFMVQIVSNWEADRAAEKATREAADIAVEAVVPATRAAEQAAEAARQAADEAKLATEQAAAAVEQASSRVADEIARRVADEAVRGYAMEQARKARAEADAAGLVAVMARAEMASYEQARWDPLHFSPAIDSATDEQCLVCHAEVLQAAVRETSPAGVQAAEALAWYQTLDTYQGDQQTFHQRHITSQYADDVMNLACNFCHRGNDPREEAAMTPLASGSTQLVGLGPSRDQPAFTLRKMVNPSDSCLRCHGSFPWQVMEGLTGPWHEIRGDFEFEEGENGCLTCHGELFRTVRHQVTYLNAERIEELAASGSDVCYGCHGGRAWYRIAYPYPRNPWPDMAQQVPDWAQARPTASDPRYRIDAQ